MRIGGKAALDKLLGEIRFEPVLLPPFLTVTSLAVLSALLALADEPGSVPGQARSLCRPGSRQGGIYLPHRKGGHPAQVHMGPSRIPSRNCRDRLRSQGQRINKKGKWVWPRGERALRSRYRTNRVTGHPRITTKAVTGMSRYPARKHPAVASKESPEEALMAL
jgi:hypothetical protein